MLNIHCLVIAFITIIEVEGANIMLNKPSIQSGTYTHPSHADSSFTAGKANDGSKTGYPSATLQRQDPYWQGDLQGFYTVSSISVTSTDRNWLQKLKKAIIGVSVHDVSCPRGEVTRCGQWPDEVLYGFTKSFNCSHAGPVRFVRIWRETYDHLNLAEVEVEGEPSRITGTVYEEVMHQKVISPITSLSVASVIGCGAMCLWTQPCLAFSYSTSEEPNCFLGTDIAVASQINWTSYSVMTCFTLPANN